MQPDLFDNPVGKLKRMSRRDDPATSKQGALAILRDLGKRQKAALEAVRQNPGSTAAELGDERVRKRLTELEAYHLIHRGMPRPCRITGHNAQTWWPVHHRREQ